MEELTPEQIAEIGRQLGHPKGEMGVEIGNRMLDSNISMIRQTIRSLELQKDDKVLELGHGNGGHIHTILQAAENITYTGVEISELMHHEAWKRNDEAVKAGTAVFHLYEGQLLPEESGKFTKAMAVNSIYFWKDPVALLGEIYRTLVPGGRLCLAYGQKDFMKKMPFTTQGFRLYNNDDMRELANNTPFAIMGITDHHDKTTSKTGEEVERVYSVITLER